jgi:hypothetical protein
MVTEDNDGGIRVTLKDVHRDLQEMKQILMGLSLSMPATEDRISKFEDTTEKQIKDHEQRIRAVESRIWQAVGGFGLLAVLAPIVSKLLGL